MNVTLSLASLLLHSALALLIGPQHYPDIPNELRVHIFFLMNRAIQESTEVIQNSTPKDMFTAQPDTSPVKNIPVTHPCPRPFDRYGARYQTVTGTFIARHEGVAAGQGGKFVVVKALHAAAPQSEVITDEVFEQLESVQPGTVITLFSYVAASMSGAHPPYSCMEFSDASVP